MTKRRKSVRGWAAFDKAGIVLFTVAWTKSDAYQHYLNMTGITIPQMKQLGSKVLRIEIKEVKR